MTARTTVARRRAARQRRLVGVAGTLTINTITFVVVVHLLNPPSAMIGLLLVVLAAGSIANIIGGKAAEITGVAWVALAMFTGFLVFINLMMAASNLPGTDIPTIAAFENITFLASLANILFSFLSARR